MSEFYRWEISEENLRDVLQPNIGSVTEPVLLSSLESDQLSSLEPTENLLRSNFDLIPTRNTKWFDSPSLEGGKNHFLLRAAADLIAKMAKCPCDMGLAVPAPKGGEKCLREGEHTVPSTKGPRKEFSPVSYTNSAAEIDTHTPE